jgi:hypothetical protein
MDKVHGPWTTVATRSTVDCSQGSGTSSPELSGAADRARWRSPRGEKEIEEDVAVPVMPSMTTRRRRWKFGASVLWGSTRRCDCIGMDRRSRGSLLTAKMGGGGTE